MLHLLCFLISSVCFPADDYDIVVYGGTSAGVMAAVQGASMGKSVVLIEQSNHLGGMTSSGLGVVDKKNEQALGGLAQKFFHAIWTYYKNPDAWVWQPNPQIQEPFDLYFQVEPHVAENFFNQMVQEEKVHVVLGDFLDRKNGVQKVDGKIVSIGMESGRVFKAKMFIDASYVGDLMKAAGVSYTIGREANATYKETLNGIHCKYSRSQKFPGIDPYQIQGDPASGLLPRIHPDSGGLNGEQDQKIQAYNYRMCLTNVPQNRADIKKPENYKEEDYELVFRAIEAGYPLHTYVSLSPIPNLKTDSNNAGPFSTDYVGMNSSYPEADYKTRSEIALAHENWQRGLLWTLQNHPRVPAAIRNHYSPWGLAKDEFQDNKHWPYEIYVREARRMISDVVINENTVKATETPPIDPIGLGTYSMDSHIVKYFVASDGKVGLDGSFYVRFLSPYKISYRSIIPKKAECQNLLVPVCLSASHVAYGSLRMEYTFMILGQSAAIAASLAIDQSLPLQDLPYEVLKTELLTYGQVLDLP